MVSLQSALTSQGEVRLCSPMNEPFVIVCGMLATGYGRPDLSHRGDDRQGSG